MITWQIRGIFMLKKLNEVEIENFTKRYSNYLKEDVQDVNCLEMFGLKTFLVRY